MKVQEFIKSKKFKVALCITGVLLIIFTSFASGVAVGLHKAKFSYAWGKNYEQNFMGFGQKNELMSGNKNDRGGKLKGRHKGMMDFSRKIEGRDFRNAHGLAGTVVSVSDNSLLVKDRDNKENTVAVTDKTIIKNRMSDVKITELKTDDQLVIMGKPNEEGTIIADLIRVFGCEAGNKCRNNN